MDQRNTAYSGQRPTSPARTRAAEPLALTRRAAMFAPLGLLAGCSWFQGWFGSNKKPLPGRREEVMAAEHGLEAPKVRPAISLPMATANADWPQPGGNPAHDGGVLRTAAALNEAWHVSIGAGGGYRRKITAQPIVWNGRIYTMDSNAVISAFDLRNGTQRWRVATKAKHDRSSNVGGGIAIDGGMLVATTGRGDVVALDAATGAPRWRTELEFPARSSPTIADGRVFLTTLDQKLLALSAQDGKQQWSHAATKAETLVLGEPAPAYASGVVVAGFGSGDLLALRADTGAIAWTDSISAAGGRGSMADISAITGMPVIEGGRVFALGQGGLMVSFDLPTGRRLWEREVGGAETPWAAGDWLFIVSLESRAAALDTRDGSVAWVSDLPRWKNVKEQRNPITWFGPVLAGDRLVFAGTDKSAVAVSPYDGKILGSRKLKENASLAPVVASGMLFIVTADGSLVAFR